MAGLPTPWIKAIRSPSSTNDKWAARFDDHTRVVVPQGYHFPMCDAPELVADAVAGWHRATVERAPSLRRAGAARL